MLMHRAQDQIGEHETKFILPNVRAPKVRSWLSLRCQPDPKYAVGIISSIYFDTRDWKFLGEKLNSDHLKTKVRLRWYSDPKTKQVLPGTYLEFKYKIGSARKKIRIKTDIDSEKLASSPLENLEMLNIPALGREHGIILPFTLHPAFQLNYLRHRYVDAFTGARLALDCNIHTSRVNSTMMQGCNSTYLSDAVFEIKQTQIDLPEWLQQITAFGCRKNAFSKYLNCYSHATGQFF